MPETLSFKALLPAVLAAKREQIGVKKARLDFLSLSVLGALVVGLVYRFIYLHMSSTV